MSTLTAVAFTLSTGIPGATSAPGPLSNTSMSSGSTSVTGTAADDVTAAAENADCTTNEEYSLFHEVMKKVTGSSSGVSTVTLSAPRVAPALASPSVGTMG